MEVEVILRLINNYFNKLDKLMLSISVVTLFIMMIWIFTDVLLRYFFNSPIQGTLELTGEYFMVLIVYLTISYTEKGNEHVYVALFYDKFPNKLKSVTKFSMNILGSAIFLYIAYLNFQRGLAYFEQNVQSSGIMNYPIAPALFIISFGLAMLSLRLILESVFLIIKEK